MDTLLPIALDLFDAEDAQHHRFKYSVALQEKCVAWLARAEQAFASATGTTVGDCMFMYIRSMYASSTEYVTILGWHAHRRYRITGE